MNWTAPTTRSSYLLAILSGVLLALAFPPMGFSGGMLAFVALVPLLIALNDTKSLGQTFKLSFVSMFILGIVANYWVGGWTLNDPFMMMGGALLAIVHPFFLIVPFLLYDITRRRFGDRIALYSLPVFYAGFEYWHSFGDLAYPWLSLYNTQTYNLAFDQFIEYTGPFALTILVVLVNVEIFQLLRGTFSSARVLKHLVAIILLLGIPYLYGTYATQQHEYSHTSLRVTIVQPNIDPWAKWNTNEQRTLDTNFSASMTALRQVHDSTDLLLWPEMAITFYITVAAKADRLKELYQFVDSIHHPILTGFPDIEGYVEGKDDIPEDAKLGSPGLYYRDWNAAMLLYRQPHPGSTMVREAYHKQKLVPLGEHVPYVEILPFLGKIFHWGVGLGSWNYGTEYEPLVMPLMGLPDDTASAESKYDTLKIIPTICYESIYPSYVRKFVDRGANVLANITNDGWFGRSWGPYQHEQFAVLRAIENRRWFVCSANTGVSVIIDDRGRIIKSLPLSIAGSITGRVPLIERRTLYVAWGDYIAIPSMIYSIAILLYAIATWTLARYRRRRRG